MTGAASSGTSRAQRRFQWHASPGPTTDPAAGNPARAAARSVAAAADNRAAAPDPDPEARSAAPAGRGPAAGGSFRC